jgi:hypothetical protein
MQEALILDYRGILCSARIPIEVLGDAEKEALNMVKQYFEATGRSMDAIPTDVKSILTRAKVMLQARKLGIQIPK